MCIYTTCLFKLWQYFLVVTDNDSSASRDGLHYAAVHNIFSDAFGITVAVG